MARSNNKYASLNFNDIYEKKLSSNDPNNNKQSLLPSNNKTIISNSRIHGNMLVLSRPTPKSISLPSPSSAPPPPPQQQQQPQQPAVIGSSDSISLRPLGSTGSLQIPKEEVAHVSSLVSPKTNRFVPPHLRPGFGGREVKPESPPGVRPVSRQGQGHFGVLSPSPCGGEETARPKSGGGMRRGPRGFESSSDTVAVMNRPGSRGARPSSSGL